MQRIREVNIRESIVAMLRSGDNDPVLWLGLVDGIKEGIHGAIVYSRRGTINLYFIPFVILFYNDLGRSTVRSKR